MGYINGIMKGGLAQLVERWNHNPQVEGSSPPAATTYKFSRVQSSMIELFVFIVICGCTAMVYSKLILLLFSQ